MNKFRCKNSCIRIARLDKNVFLTSKSKRKKILIRILRSVCFIFKCLLHLWHFYENALFSYYLRRIHLFSRTSWNLLGIFYVNLNITSYFALKKKKSKKGNCIYSWPVSKRYQVYWIQFLINGLVYLWNLWTCSKRSDLR